MKRTTHSADYWHRVDKYYQTDGWLCDNCPHCEQERESYPYGEGSVYQVFLVCTLLEEQRGYCPAIIDEEEEEDDE